MVALQFYDAYKSHLLTIYVAEERFKAVKQTTSSALHLTSQSAESSKNPSSSTISNKKKCYFNKRPPGKDIVQQQAPEIWLEPKKPKGNCFHCGKPGHWTRDCPPLRLGTSMEYPRVWTGWSVGNPRIRVATGSESKQIWVLQSGDTGTHHRYLPYQSISRFCSHKEPYGGLEFNLSSTLIRTKTITRAVKNTTWMPTPITQSLKTPTNGS